MSNITKFLHKNWQQKTLLSTALLPFSLPYYLAFLHKKKLSQVKKFKPFIVCIGNVTSGGNGKTQVEIELAKLLQTNYKVAFLTIGYKGSLQQATLVTSAFKASEVGEEALVLQKIAPTCVAKNRLEGLKLLEEKGFEIILMDDGYQNFKIEKDLNILVVYGNYGFGNQRLIPAGPLREPLENAVLRADIICVVDKDKKVQVKGVDESKTVYTNYEIANLEDFNLKEGFLAFSALGFNEKFFNTLKTSGFKVKHTVSFKDHHFYSEQDLQKIIQKAKKMNLQIVTSSKDYIKIPQMYKNVILEAKAKLQTHAIIKIANTIKDMHLQKTTKQ